MGKINKRNRKGEIIKTEHKYSKGPLLYVHEGENNSIFTVTAEMCKDSDPIKSNWMRYYNDVIYNDYLIHEDKSKDLYEIVRNIENENIKNEFFKFLIKNEYNPYNEMIETNIPYIQKIQKFLKENYGFAQILEINRKKILIMYEKKDDRLMSKIYLNYIDGVILYKYSHTSIILNDNVEQTYNKLLEKEDYWELSKNKVIHTNGKKTGLNFKSKTLLERIF
jgi:hypothetical protein